MATESGVSPSSAARLRSDFFSRHPQVPEVEAPAAQERTAWFRALSEISVRELGRDPEWRALGTERDPSLFDAAVFQLALRCETGGREALAAELYASLVGFASASEFAPRARARLDGLRGTGAFGLRFEGALRRFSSEALDPAALAGFVAGGLAFRLGRAWALGRFAAAGLAENPFLLRSLAAGLGFGAEVPAFVFGARGAAALLGRPVAWDTASLGKDLASALLVLGPMKLIGAGGSGLASRLGSPRSATAKALVGASVFAGILVGHRLEQAAGLRPAQSAAGTAFDSLVTLLQSHVAGGLANGLLGPNFRHWEQSLDRAAQAPLRSEPPEAGRGAALGGALGPRPAWAAAVSGGAASTITYPGEVSQKGAGVSLMATRGGGGLPKKVVSFDRGALAWGTGDALNWLLELRRHLENKGGPTKPGDFELWWIPETPIDTVLLNDFGVVYRQGPARLERVNTPKRIPLRATWPVLRKGEAFVHTADLSSDLGRVLNQWTEREDAGLQSLINSEWLELQFENLCRKKLGFVERLEEKGRVYLLFEKGKRQLLPPNLGLYALRNDPRSLEAQAAPRRFMNQYWWHSPTEAAQLFGARFGEEMPQGAIVSHFLDPRALMLPTWAAPLGPAFAAKFFFMQGHRTWVAEAVGGQLRDVTAQEPAKRLALLQELARPKPVEPEVDTTALPLLEASASEKVGTKGEPAGTKPYPAEGYPNAIFNAATVPYPEMFPKVIDPEKSMIMPLAALQARIPEMTTGPTAKLTGEPETTPMAQPPRQDEAIPLALPLPAPDPSAKATPTPAPVVRRDHTGLDPTLELTPALSQQMLEPKPLPYADTLMMDADQVAAIQRSAKRRPWTYLASLGRDFAQAWRHRAWIWTELRISLYRWIGRQPPPAWVARAQSYRELFKK